MCTIGQFKARNMFKSSKYSKTVQSVCHVTPQTKELALTSAKLQTNAQDYWGFWTFPSSGILETIKHGWICFRPQVKGAFLRGPPE
jgi:hypothetical protein